MPVSQLTVNAIYDSGFYFPPAFQPVLNFYGYGKDFNISAPIPCEEGETTVSPNSEGIATCLTPTDS